MRNLREAAVDRLAAQWTALGGQLASRSERSVVDPEALLVATSRLGGDDPRVYEIAVAWCVAFGAPSTSLASGASRVNWMARRPLVSSRPA